MSGLRTRNVLAILALVSAIGACLLLTVLPLYQSESCVRTGQEMICTGELRTLTDASNAGRYLLIPVTVFALPAASTFVRHVLADVLLWGVAVLAVFFCIVTGFSIGLFFVPAALLLLCAAAVGR